MKIVNKAALVAFCLLVSIFIVACGSDNPVNPIDKPVKPVDTVVVKDSAYYVRVCREKSTKFFKILGIDVDFSQVRIPSKPPGFNCLVFMPKGFNYSMLREAEKLNYKHYATQNNYEWIYAINLKLEERTTDSSYAFWCKEPNLDDYFYPDDIWGEDVWKLNKDNKVKTMTRLEYGAYSLSSYLLDSITVDVERFTMCTGSGAGGSIPGCGHPVNQGFTIQFSTRDFLNSKSCRRVFP